ncbi:hypothetical protein SAMD00019534_015360 [Acytostelium subglobosum LB1]|uniref:hypothetical protein n=1 Tax=Acytostelium subglobosum LB1 TaxID=1410327 RepID=UPI00064489C3|nr:hypothetical protein SAMD00019534_015360 [Acytostelium subglobosum LB1]GAM18361.1 hypothetical protein SAMD00019534_015360 [Acytostelium subglobosum LB1]|eukprot:XP_012757581.1 hypothetical protein SAMD00019534_015360 [Acytostelium subglobosum LB1]
MSQHTQTPVDIEQTNSSSPDYIDAQTDDDETVLLNVGGYKYEVRPSTLSRFPDTLLGNMFLPTNKHLRRPDKKGEYFFDRNGRVFEIILNFYRTGKLVIPTDVPQELIREELRFFKISSDDSDNQENEDEKIMKQPRDQIFNYANSLVHSSSRFDIKRGLYFLQRLRELDTNSFLYKYSIAFAYYRLGKNKQGIETLEEILENDPHNPQAKSLMALFGDSRMTNATIGLAAVSLLVVGLFGLWKLRQWWRVAASVASSTTSSALPAAATATTMVAASTIPAVTYVAAAAPAVIPSVVSNAGKIIVEVANNEAVLSNASSTTAAAAVPIIQQAATTVAHTVASGTPASTTAFLEAMSQSLPTPDQFRR